MNRRRKRELLRQLRSNMKAQGHTTVDQLSDRELEELVEGFGPLDQMVALTNPAARRFLEALDPPPPARQPPRSPTPAPKPAGSHDDAGELVRLIGGPMDEVMAREGAPVLEVTWSKDGRYVQGDRDPDGFATAAWNPS